MATLQPLRDEHAELFPHIEALAQAGDAVDGGDVRRLRAAVDASYHFLAHHLIPHAEAEERALYPVVQRVLGAPEATGTMTRDHVEVGRLTDELAQLRELLSGVDEVDDAVAGRLRRALYGLHTLVRVHFAKEEEVYLPILEARLTDDEATDLVHDLQHAHAHQH